MSSKLGLFVLVFLLSVSFAYGVTLYCGIIKPDTVTVACSDNVVMDISEGSFITSCSCDYGSCDQEGTYIGYSYSNDLTFWDLNVNTSSTIHETEHLHLAASNKDTVIVGYGIAQRGSTDAAAMNDPTDIACCLSNLNCSADSKCYRDNRANGTIPNKYYCNDTRWFGGDTNRDICETITGKTGIWNIGGEVSQNTCCGDDNGENVLTRVCGSGCVTDINDKACCNLATDCVYSSGCFAETPLMVAPWDDGSESSWAMCSANEWTAVDIDIVDCEDTDSTDSDGGDKPLLKGTLTDYLTGSAPCPVYLYNDSCAGNILTEYYPNGVGVSSKTYDCTDFEVVAVDLDGDDPTTINTCTAGTGASCTADAYVTTAGTSGTDSCQGTCGTGVNSCQFIEWIVADSADSCLGLDTCTAKLYDADTNSNTCNECKGAGYWQLGGEVAANACCGDDISEKVVTEASDGTDTPAGYDDGGTTCCSDDTDCANDGACFASGTNSSVAIPNTASCRDGFWYGGDDSEDDCMAIVGSGRWALGNGEVATDSCCGDDDGEYYKSRTSPDYAACCDTANDWLDPDLSEGCRPFSELPETYVYGYVRDNTGMGIEDATVKVLSGSTSNVGDINKTDTNGYYTLHVQPGSFYFMGYAPAGFTANFSEMYIVNSGNDVRVDFTLWPTTLSCEDDCTYNEDNYCHSICDGVNGCVFYNELTKSKCDNKGAGFTMLYDAENDVVCCEGTPFRRTNARILSYDTANKIRQVRVVMFGGKLVQMILDVFRSG